MKVINIKIPSFSDIQSIPAFKRKDMNAYCLDSQSTSLNNNLLTYVNSNGLIATSGKKYEGESTKLIIEYQLEENEEINIGDIIEYNGIPFEVITENKAISLQSISIDNLFVEQYSTSDPNKGNDLFAGYIVNKDALQTWYDNSEKTASLIECEKYDSTEHVSIEKELISEIIEYSYQNQLEKEKRLYGNDKDTWILTEDKKNKELETPNIFVLNLTDFFIEAINNKYSIEDCAFYLLKQNKQFDFSVDPDNLSSEQQELLKKEIQKIQKVYLLTQKYVELNNTYNNYLTDFFQNNNSKIQL